MKKTKLLAIALGAALLLASCGGKDNKDSSKVETSTESSISSEVSEIESKVESVESKVESEVEAKVEAVKESLDDIRKTIIEKYDGVTPDAYPELEVTAAILERKAILPGMPVSVHVSVENKGAKPVQFAVGSGSAVVPDAIQIYSEGMPVLPPKEHLGAMTADMQYNVLKPGETLQYKYEFLAIEPVENIQEMALEMMKDGVYIGEASLEDIQAKFPEVKAVEPGSYKGEAIMFFTPMTEGEEADPTGAPTTYTVAEFEIPVA